MTHLIYQYGTLPQSVRGGIATGAGAIAICASYLAPKTLLTAIVIAATCFATLSAFAAPLPKPIKAEILFVLYDAGETNALLPVLQDLERRRINFRVLVMATAATKITPNMFPGKVLTLRDVGIKATVDANTPRTRSLSIWDEFILSLRLDPKAVVVGVASRIQESALRAFPNAKTFAYLDNFNYDPAHESFATVEKVQAAAKHVLCPGNNVIQQFKKDKTRKFQVVGKPSLDAWDKTIAEICSPNGMEQMIEKTAPGEQLNQLLYTQRMMKEIQKTNKVAITLIGGYGKGYEVIDPLFVKLKKKLEEKNYIVFNQLHPKVLSQTKQKADLTTEQALALSKLSGGTVIGYNSSVPFDAALIGIDALYIAPEDAPPFKHFAVQERIMPSVKSMEELLQHLEQPKQPQPLRELLQMPANSTELIIQAI